MTDIKRVIQELRGRINDVKHDSSSNVPEGWWLKTYELLTTLHELLARKYWDADDMEHLSVAESFRVFSVKLGQTVPVDWGESLAALDRLASSVEGGTVDLTARITAAAEEIAHKTSMGCYISKIVLSAIIRRHIEGGK